MTALGGDHIVYDSGGDAILSLSSPFMRFLLDPSAETAWMSGYALHSYSFTQKDESWLLVIRVNSHKGGRLVAFIEAHSQVECMLLWHKALGSKHPILKWRPDKYT